MRNCAVFYRGHAKPKIIFEVFLEIEAFMNEGYTVTLDIFEMGISFAAFDHGAEL